MEGKVVSLLRRDDGSWFNLSCREKEDGRKDKSSLGDHLV